MTTNTTENNGKQNLSAIDKAIAAARARKDSKANGATAAGTATTSTPKAKMTDAERAAKQKQIEEDRAARKTKREEERAAKKAELEAKRQPAHMKKVAKAAEKLGTLSESAQLLFNEATANLTSSDLTSLALHIQHFNRTKSTELAGKVELAVGQAVEIISGEQTKYIGQVGIVVKAQRIRCYVHIEGANNRPVPGTDDTGVYFFTSDVRQIEVPAGALEGSTEDDAASDDDQQEDAPETDESSEENEPVAATG